MLCWDPAAGLLFAVAAITDSLDGYLARRLGQTTPLGTFLDPVADKLIVATGARHSYFGHEAWAPFAPGLKSIGDALEIRRRVLSAFATGVAKSSARHSASDRKGEAVGMGMTFAQRASRRPPGPGEQRRRLKGLRRGRVAMV